MIRLLGLLMLGTALTPATARADIVYVSLDYSFTSITCHPCYVGGVVGVNTTAGTFSSILSNVAPVQQLVPTPDGRKLYVLNGGRLSAIDLRTRRDLPVNGITGALRATIAPDGKRLYLTTTEAGTITVVDTASDLTLATVAVTGSVANSVIAGINASGTRLYLLAPSSGTVLVLETTSLSVLASYSVGRSATAVVAPEGSLYVTSMGGQFVSVLRASDGVETRTFRLAGHPTQFTLSPGGTKLFVFEAGANQLETLTLNTGASTITVLPPGVSGIVAGNDETRVFAPSYERLRAQVLTIDTRTGTVTASTISSTTLLTGMQLAVAPPATCTADVAPVPVVFDGRGGTRSVRLSMIDECDWTARTNSADFSVSPQSGSGDATLTVTAVPATTGTTALLFVSNAQIPLWRALPRMTIDTPTTGARIVGSFVFGGWAVEDVGPDNFLTGTGVNTVHVWAMPDNGGPSRFIGAAQYGLRRDDVTASLGVTFRLGGPYATAGFDMIVPELPAGKWRLTAYAYSTRTNTFNNSASVDVSIETPPTIPSLVIDTPVNGARVTLPFLVGGWAVDRRAQGTAGVDVVHVWAYPEGAGEPVSLGAASYPLTRPDVAVALGSPQFTASGFSLMVATLTPGRYKVVVYGRSTVTGAFSIVNTVNVTVDGLSGS